MVGCGYLSARHCENTELPDGVEPDAGPIFCAAEMEAPASWRYAYEDGADGCMPSGWYAIGYGKNGFPISEPNCRHEYGPFESKNVASAFAAKVDAKYAINPSTYERTR